LNKLPVSPKGPIATGLNELLSNISPMTCQLTEFVLWSGCGASSGVGEFHLLFLSETQICFIVNSRLFGGWWWWCSWVDQRDVKTNW
jgi:hypothetical protein